jgi:hypothetical protein
VQAVCKVKSRVRGPIKTRLESVAKPNQVAEQLTALQGQGQSYQQRQGQGVEYAKSKDNPVNCDHNNRKLALKGQLQYV